MAEGGEISVCSGSEYIYDFFCELCIDDNKQVEAYGYCHDCAEYLCEVCYNGHTRSRSTRHHVLMNQDNMPKDTPLSSERVNKDISAKCKSHRAKPVEFYCISHDELGCSTCFATVHKSCPDVKSVLEKSENILDSQPFKEFITSLQTMKTKSEDMIKRSIDNKTLVQKCCSDAVRTVRHVKEEVIEILNEIENSIVTLVEKICLEDENQMENVAEECNAISKQYEEMDSELERLRSSKRKCQLYIKMRETEGEVTALKESLRNAEKKNVVRTFTFEPNTELKAFLESPDVLGKIVFENQQEISPPNPNDPTVTNLYDLKIRFSGDFTHCRITGLAVLSNFLVVIDHGNRRIKVLDTNSHRLIDDVSCKTEPWDVAVISKNRVAVTFPDSKKIAFLKVTNNGYLKKEKVIFVRGRCYGVAHSQNRLFVSYADSGLEKIELWWDILDITDNDLFEGEILLKGPSYVCVSKDDETTYLSDHSRGTVTSLTLDGVVKSVYNDDELKCPGKACTDHHGNVFVCGTASRNVHMVTADCKKVKVILTQADGLDSDVYSVSHCQDTNRLFIGMWRNNIVKVYQLS